MTPGTGYQFPEAHERPKETVAILQEVSRSRRRCSAYWPQSATAIVVTNNIRLLQTIAASPAFAPPTSTICRPMRAATSRRRALVSRCSPAGTITESVPLASWTAARSVQVATVVHCRSPGFASGRSAVESTTGSAACAGGATPTTPAPSPTRRAARSRPRSRPTVRLPTGHIAGSVQLAYATTVHRTQGSTTDRAHALVTPDNQSSPLSTDSGISPWADS